MDLDSVLMMVTVILGFYMAWNIGANDVANAMGTSVGSKALSLKKAVIIAAVLEFSGAFFVGSNVSQTIQKGIISPEVFNADPMIFVIGMLGALLATGALLQVASYFGLPISTTHAIVGAVIGFGALIGGIGAVHWAEVGSIALSWLLSPVLSGIVAYFIFHLIQRKILYALDPMEATRRIAPFFVFACFSFGSLSLIYNGLHQLDLGLHFHSSMGLALSIGLVAAYISSIFIRRIPESAFQTADGFNPYQAVSLEKAIHHLQRVHLSNRNEEYSDQITNLLSEMRTLNADVKKNTQYTHTTTQYQGVEKIFVYLQILSASLVAFAHGANDVANAIGPMGAIFGVLTKQSSDNFSIWLLALGGFGIVIGLATWGWRVIETIGKKITELTPTRGFAAEFGAATTILLASKMGLPISTTHALVGAVFGVGMARGIKALNLRMLKEIFFSWIITVPLCALFSIAAFYLLKFLLL